MIVNLLIQTLINLTSKSAYTQHLPHSPPLKINCKASRSIAELSFWNIMLIAKKYSVPEEKLLLQSLSTAWVKCKTSVCRGHNWAPHLMVCGFSGVSTMSILHVVSNILEGRQCVWYLSRSSRAQTSTDGIGKAKLAMKFRFTAICYKDVLRKIQVLFFSSYIYF